MVVVTLPCAFCFCFRFFLDAYKITCATQVLVVFTDWAWCLLLVIMAIGLYMIRGILSMLCSCCSSRPTQVGQAAGAVLWINHPLSVWCLLCRRMPDPRFPAKSAAHKSVKSDETKRRRAAETKTLLNPFAAMHDHV